MSNYALSLKRTGLLLAALTFTALLMVVNLASFFGKASAAQLTSRSVTLSSSLPGSATDGDPGTETNGAEATHTFTFTTGADGDDAVAIRFQYCTTALGTCNLPTGLVTGGVTVGTLTGVSGLVIDSVATNGTIDLDTGTFGANTTTTIALEDIQNPDEIEAFYVRITTYSDAFVTQVDEGTVASAIVDGIEITARVAETLGFSVTGDFAGVGAPGGSCAPLTGTGAITLGDPANENTLSLTAAYDNYSAFRVYTNAANGVDIMYEGDTLRHSSGNDTITPIGAVAALSDFGTEQFGLAIDPSVGGNADIDSESRENMNMANVTASGDFADDGALNFEAVYDGGAGDIQEGPSVAEFAFVTNDDPDLRAPQRIAYTDGYTECKTAAVRYLANISPTTTSGTYTTTIVYLAVPTY